MSYLDLLFPKRCAFCRRRSKEPLCDNCQEKLPWVETQGQDCLAVFHYRDSVRQMLHRYKYMGSMGYSGVLGKLMADCVRQNAPEAGPQLVVWVPSSSLRLRKRGYDQSHRLAMVVANTLDLPLQRALVKTQHTVSQTRLKDQYERAVNVAGAFRATCSLEGRSVLLVDDIYTTGATMRECKALLEKAGAHNLVCVAAARK